MPTTDAKSAWYDDPTERHRLRYFDGEHWTAHVSDLGEMSLDQLPADPLSAPTPAHQLPAVAPGAETPDLNAQVAELDRRVQVAMSAPPTVAGASRQPSPASAPSLTPQAPPPKTHRRRFVVIGIGASLVVIVGIVLVLTLRRNGNSTVVSDRSATSTPASETTATTTAASTTSATTTSTSARPALSVAENALLAHVPSAIRSTCKSGTESVKGYDSQSVAALTCIPDAGAHVVVVTYSQEPDTATMNQVYQERLGMLDITANTGAGDACPQEEAYDKDPAKGRVACGLHSSDSPEIVWTTDGLNILSDAIPDSDTNASALWQWWLAADHGPVE